MEANDYIKNSIELKQKILNDEKIISLLDEIVFVIVNAYKNGGKVLAAGNGGSAADAQHVCGELVSKFFIERPALNAYALTTNSSILTSISNDLGYENIFSRQINAQGKKGDVFIAISTSGNSPNIVNAVIEAKKIGLITVGLTGLKSAKMDEYCDFLIKVPSDVTPLIQESHLMLEHIICAKVEEEIFRE